MAWAPNEKVEPVDELLVARRSERVHLTQPVHPEDAWRTLEGAEHDRQAGRSRGVCAMVWTPLPVRSR